ncbi:MAG: hypothetical protein J6R88_03690, partial [Clostridia bacterium]|nr:hypothetical protein [Clostridia bacterium]
FLTREGLLDNWQNLIDVINCGGNKENIEKGFYMCPNSGGSYSHKRAIYFGAYWWRNVNYIAEIKAVCVMHKSECVVKWNNTKLDDAEIIQEAKDKIKDFKDWNKRDVENSEMQLFLFDKLVELKYRKSTKGGMFASKRYFKTKARTIEELYKELNGKEWE